MSKRGGPARPPTPARRRWVTHIHKARRRGGAARPPIPARRRGATHTSRAAARGDLHGSFPSAAALGDTCTPCAAALGGRRGSPSQRGGAGRHTSLARRRGGDLHGAYPSAAALGDTHTPRAAAQRGHRSPHPNAAALGGTPRAAARGDYTATIPARRCWATHAPLAAARNTPTTAPPSVAFCSFTQAAPLPMATRGRGRSSTTGRVRAYKILHFVLSPAGVALTGGPAPRGGGARVLGGITPAFVKIVPTEFK